MLQSALSHVTVRSPWSGVLLAVSSAALDALYQIQTLLAQRSLHSFNGDLRTWVFATGLAQTA